MDLLNLDKQVAHLCVVPEAKAGTSAVDTKSSCAADEKSNGCKGKHFGGGFEWLVRVVI